MTVSLDVEDLGRLLSEGLTQEVAARGEKLGRIFGRLQSGKVVVEGPGRHPLPGRYRIRLVLTVPDTRIVINEQSGENLPSAIGASFDAAERRLADHARAVRESREGGGRKRPNRRS